MTGLGDTLSPSGHPYSQPVTHPDRRRPPRALTDTVVAGHRVMAQVARREEADWWRSAGIVEGATVAELGCGPGLVLAELASVVGPSGQVVGVDRQAGAVATAARVIGDLELDHASVRQADLWASGLEPGAFDVVSIRYVLVRHRSAEQLRIIEHARALLRPGGAIYLVDVDLGGARADPALPDLIDLVDRHAELLALAGQDPAVGPRLGSMARSAGFEQVERWATMQMPPPMALAAIRPPAWGARRAMVERGLATEADVVRWDRALTEFAVRAAKGEAAVFTPLYGVVARTPAD